MQNYSPFCWAVLLSCKALSFAGRWCLHGGPFWLTYSTEFSSAVCRCLFKFLAAGCSRPALQSWVLGIVKSAFSSVCVCLQWSLSRPEAEGKSLWLSVWDHSRMKHNTFLGEVRIILSTVNFDDDTSKEYELCDRVSFFLLGFICS